MNERRCLYFYSSDDVSCSEIVVYISVVHIGVIVGEGIVILLISLSHYLVKSLLLMNMFRLKDLFSFM